MTRGELRVYLGAAPGVGKTFAMLDEGYRRRERGTDVVIGVVETHGRARTIAQLRDLEVVPRRSVEYRGTTLPEMDVDAVIARRPALVLVDELAHTNVPGSRNAKRWQDVAEVLDAGIDVITTVNVQHLESLNDVVQQITGIVQRETVPDSMVRAADQIELVDMSPEALRRRLAHGNVYPAERVDAALRNYFREGNLAALRELALLWVADRVEDGLDRYRSRHGITDPWETRERIVVALTGAPSGERLVRRAARIAARSRGELIGVHVTAADGLRDVRPAPRAELDRLRVLVEELGGRFHEISGEDVGGALLQFARSQEATQLVLGAAAAVGGRRTRRTGSVIGATVTQAGDVDVHVIATRAVDGPTRPSRQRSSFRASPLPRHRIVGGLALLAIGLPALTVVLTTGPDATLATDLLLYLVVVVGAAAMGGWLPGLVGAVAASLVVNYYLVPPVHTFTIGQVENALALAVFIVVAAVVSGFVDLAERRARQSRRAQADAEALAATTATLIGASDAAPALIERLRATFRLDGLELLRRSGAAWSTVAGSGDARSDGRVIELGDDIRLGLHGRALSAEEERSLTSHAGQLVLAVAAHEREQSSRRADALAEIDALRSAMLQSVTHDLRTPLAGIKAGITSLLAPDVAWSPEATKEFLETVDVETDQLTELVDNLVDMSRVQAGAVTPLLDAVDLDDAVAGALARIPRRSVPVDVSIPDELPAVLADGDLLERALANVIRNAVRWAPVGTTVAVSAERLGDGAVVTVVDRGPGIPRAARAEVLRPFQRFDDVRSRHGTGLGLAVADGLIVAMGGSLALHDTPGGGLTVAIHLPTAEPG